MNPKHSEHCKCECDLLAVKIKKIIEARPKSLLVMMIEIALNGVCECPPELLYKNDHYAWCASL